MEQARGAPGGRTLNQRIKSPLLHLILLSELVSNNASTYRELPFCPIACIRAALWIQSCAGVYRGVRANMEQPSVLTGLDLWVPITLSRPLTWPDGRRANSVSGCAVAMRSGTLSARVTTIRVSSASHSTVTTTMEDGRWLGLTGVSPTAYAGRAGRESGPRRARCRWPPGCSASST